MTTFNQTVKGMMGRCVGCTVAWTDCVPDVCFGISDEYKEMQEEFAIWDDARLEKEEKK